MNRLVVFELHHLGDAVMALPFLRGARDHFRITVVCRPAVGDFLRHILPGVDILSPVGSWVSLARAARGLRLTTRDAAACVWADSRVHLLMRLTGAGVRVGFPMTPTNYYAPDLPWRRRRLQVGRALTAVVETFSGNPLLTHPVQRHSPTQHHQDDWAALAAPLGFAPAHRLPWIPTDPPLLPGDLRIFLNRFPGLPILLVHPGGRLPTKRWPYFQDLLGRMPAHQATIILQPPDEPAPAPVGPNQILLAVPDWPQLLAVFQAADAVVCNDSFPAHLAAALGKPVVTIFGSGNPAWFAPFGNADNVASTSACPFRPCIDRCVMPSLVCLESVSVDLVESRLRRILDAG